VPGSAFLAAGFRPEDRLVLPVRAGSDASWVMPISSVRFGAGAREEAGCPAPGTLVTSATVPQQA
jgi:hypothetical protein